MNNIVMTDYVGSEDFIRMQKRKRYTSLDDMAREEGVNAVLEFLAYNPTVISTPEGVFYRHTKIKNVPFIVAKIHDSVRL